MATATKDKSSKTTASKAGSKTQRKETRASAKPADAIKLLKDDHREVKKWFKDYEKLEEDSEKQELAQKICLALTVHTRIEEEIFYPAARGGIDDDDLLDEAEVEHASAKALIEQILSMKPGDDLYDAKVTVLGEYVEHHVEEEESEMFPECRDADLDLKGLGAQMAKRKAELMKEAGQ